MSSNNILTKRNLIRIFDNTKHEYNCVRFSENELTKVLINLKMHLQGKELFYLRIFSCLRKENFNLHLPNRYHDSSLHS